MLKKIILTALFLVPAGFVIYLLLGKGTNFPATSPDPLPITEPIATLTQEKLNNQNKVDWLIVRDLSKLTLNDNLVSGKTSGEIISEAGCVSLVNAGFYTPEDTHTGLFVANGVKISSARTNSLFNGYFGLYKNGSPFLNQEVPADPLHAVQSGPILIRDGSPLPLSIQNDYEARRIVAAILRDGDVAFLVFYNQSSQFLGPKLGDLPKMLSDLEKSTSLRFRHAINLDGGSASVFYTENTRLTELTKIGSYFCIM